MKKKANKKAVEDLLEKSFTNYDAVKKAKELAEPIEDKSKQKRKTLLENATTVISVFVISLTIILYAYNKGYCSIFNIPIKSMPLDIRSYIPIAITVCGILSYIFIYYANLKKDIVLENRNYDPLRVLYGFYILCYLLREYHVNTYLGSVWSVIIPILVSAIIELAVFFVRKPRKKKKINKLEFDVKVEHYLIDRAIYKDYFKPGFFFLVLAILLAPYLGKISALATTQYQICSFDDERYAVIVNYDDKVLVQKAYEDNNHLTIFTSEYTFVPKEGTIFTLNKYDLVTLSTEISNESNPSSEQMDTETESPVSVELPNEFEGNVLTSQKGKEISNESENSNNNDSNASNE